MNITLTNTGIVKEAQIELKGLTVIAGENDTGKSTVGKLLFCLTKAFNTTSERLKEQRVNSIIKVINDICIEVKAKNDDTSFTNVTTGLFETLKNELMQKLQYNATLEEVKELLELKKKEFDLVIPAIGNTGLDYDRTFEAIYKKAVESFDIQKLYKTVLQKYIASMFKGELSNKYTGEEAHITAFDGDSKLFDININNNSIADLEMSGTLPFNGATLVESPAFLPISGAVVKAVTMLDIDSENPKEDILGKPVIPEHIRDLIYKLQVPYIEQQGKIDAVAEIIGGKMIYDSDSEDFVFIKGDKRFKSVNISAGIRYFGIIQILLKTGYLNKNSLLILDEPEINMHPMWQLKYAELIVKLVQQGQANVLLTSHSPYFIEALKVYSDKHNIVDKAKFYMAEQSEEGEATEIYDVTDNLWSIFEKLTEPFKELEREKVRRALK